MSREIAAKSASAPAEAADASSPALRLIALLEHVARAEKALTLTDIIGEVHQPKPTVYRMLQQLEQAAAKIRATQPPYDLVLVAVPLAVTPPRSAPPEAAVLAYSWILNWSLSFGLQQWDVIGITPTVLNANASPEERLSDDFARQMISAQDLNLITRKSSDLTTPQILEDWLRKSLARQSRM